MKKIIYSLLLIVSLLIVNSAAQDVTGLAKASEGQSEFESSIGGVDIGYVRVGTSEIWNLAWHPDFKFGPWGLGADLNASIGDTKPANYENYVLRYVEYDDGKKGLRYGIIENLTWGHGLLMDGYSTRLGGSVLLNNEQLAWLGYYDFDSEPYLVRALTTGKGVYGVRVEEKINPMLTLGQTYIADSDGIILPGTTTKQTVSGLGIDATTPLPMGFDGYAEYAMLMDHGGGLSTGLKWAQDFMVAAADVDISYRFLDNKFVPGYFNSEYETNPINLSSAEATGNAKNGYLAKLAVKAMGIAAMNLRYENYEDSESAVYGDLYAKLPQDIEVTGYYQQPSFVDFRSLDLEQGAVIGGSVAYPINQFSKAKVHYKKYYNSTTDQIETTRYVEMKFSF
ncbi:hypothetical protein ACFL5U_00915 [Candidatus Margulisiibacteriota bacterium]